ncbi:MAG: hypothetical protein JST00_20070 [Deltaproteobacteria bacterium]|nr:hypothetical protein [Deltaproteobacteria bacterium]
MRALADRLEAIEARLDALAPGCSGAVYSTATPERFPPGCRSRRAARDRIRAVPGHERNGTGRATTWTISVEAYRAHHARPFKAPALRVVRHDDDQAAEAALEAAGLRSTRLRRAS